MTRERCMYSKWIMNRTVHKLIIPVFFVLLVAALTILPHINTGKVEKYVSSPEQDRNIPHIAYDLKPQLSSYNVGDSGPNDGKVTEDIRVQNQRKNVLLLIADDLRPQLSNYEVGDNERMYTPSLEGLASRSLVARRAYVQQAQCAPSRSSFLTGRRPDTTHVYDLRTAFRKAGGNFTTLPQYFKQHGYTTAGIGKVYHRNEATGRCDPLSWTEPFIDPPYVSYTPHSEHSWLPVPKKDYKKNPLPDQLITQKAIETLQKMKDQRSQGNSTNFFLAVGFRKPHLPFIFPEEFLNFYPREGIHLPSNPYVPSNIPHIAWWDWGELRELKDIMHLGCTGVENNTLPDDVTLDLRRAYFACVSFVDHNVGLILKELERNGFRNDTIVVFLGDHGFLLGEHGGWCKHTNFELTTNAPLMIHVPGLTDQGLVIDELVEFVDIFPTLAELAGLPPLPLCPAKKSGKVSLCREGSSLVPLMAMSSSREVMWKDRAFSQFPRFYTHSVMGYSMRTARYRYTEWVRFDPVHYKPIWSAPIKGAELYDHDSDPQENHNVADSPGYMQQRLKLSKMLREGWRPALPEFNTETPESKA